MTSERKPIVHIGGMRTGSTYLQKIFSEHPEVQLRIKSRFFSFDPYFEQGNKFLDQQYSAPSDQIIVDSDENYSLGRFKSKLVSYQDEGFNLKSELQLISHDIGKMAERIKETYPNAKIVLVIREQLDWLKSIYKHDVEHFALDLSFSAFIKSDLGKSYLLSGEYSNLYNIYSRLFGQENIKILLYEDLKGNKADFLVDLYSFMGVSHQNIEAKKSKNKSKSDGQIFILRWINLLSQRKLGVTENRLFFKIRSLFMSHIGSLNFLARYLYSKNSEKYIKGYYKEENKLLLSLNISESKLKEFGYLEI